MKVAAILAGLWFFGTALFLIFATGGKIEVAPLLILSTIAAGLAFFGKLYEIEKEPHVRSLDRDSRREAQAESVQRDNT